MKETPLEVESEGMANDDFWEAVVVQLHTRVCAPVVFKLYGCGASWDLDYVDECYEQVCTHIQVALDDLVRKKELGISRQLESEA